MPHYFGSKAHAFYCDKINESLGQNKHVRTSFIAKFKLI